MTKKSAGGHKAWATRVKRYGPDGAPPDVVKRMREASRRGGLVSPSSFKNNPSLARQAGKKSRPPKPVHKSADALD